VVLVLASVLLRDTSSRSLDGRMGSVWPGTRAWTAEADGAYRAFVARLGAAVEARRCDRLDACLRDPEANTTFDPAIDADLHLDVDCADLPYVLRAYFAFKQDLPFGYVAATRGAAGWDARVDLGITPIAWRPWRDHATPRALLREMPGLVHSGMYRMAAFVETGDFYPVRVDRRSVAPGTVFYDPYGHVSVVARVRDDGVVHLLAGSPDGQLTWKRFGAAYFLGPRSLGGGFKRFRPISVVQGALVRPGNRALEDYDPVGQNDLARAPHGFARAVRDALAAPDVEYDPLADFEDQVLSLCRDVRDRIVAVDLAVQAGLPRVPHPGHIPDNVFTAEGAWEAYATPARDARLKAGFADLAETVLVLDDLREYAFALRDLWDRSVASPDCRFAYRDSNGDEVAFTLDDVQEQLFDLSFDPYHCPELRWGRAAPSCPADDAKRAWYDTERRLRNRIERSYGLPTPLDAGPDEPPAIDVRRLIGPARRMDVEL
jgi:hypothetical protein